MMESWRWTEQRRRRWLMLTGRMRICATLSIIFTQVKPIYDKYRAEFFRWSLNRFWLCERLQAPFIATNDGAPKASETEEQHASRLNSLLRDENQKDTAMEELQLMSIDDLLAYMKPFIVAEITVRILVIHILATQCRCFRPCFIAIHTQEFYL